MTVSEKQDGVWMHRITYISVAGWSEWRIGKANLSENFIQQTGISVDERLFAPVSPAPVSADAVVEACAKVADAAREMRERLFEINGSAYNVARISEAEEIASTIRALKGTFPAVDGWRDIADAPRDGTVFFGIGKDDRYPQPMKWESYDEDDAEELGEDGYWSYAEDLIGDVVGQANPSFWQPLPAAPSTQEEDHDNG